MIIKAYTVNPFQENTYLMISDGKAIIVDPGFASASEVNQVLQEMEKHNAELIAVLLTHAHIDHIWGLQRVIDRFDVPVYLSHTDDLYLWENFYSQASMYNIPAQPFNFTPFDYPENRMLEIGPFRMLVLDTPGHSPDHVSFYIEEEGCVIAGDALFQGSIGRTDLYKGDFDLLAKSIREKLYILPDSTRVLSGHGPETTIGEEKRSNPFVKG